MTEFLSVAMVLHPDRLALAKDMIQELRLMGVHWEGFVDTEGIGCDDNHLRAWQWLSEQDSEWCVVLEDDAVITKGFRFAEQLKMALHMAPAPVVSLYLGQGRPEFAQRKIAHALTGLDDGEPEDMRQDLPPWLVHHRLLHAVGVAIERRYLPSLLDELPELTAFRPIDEAISEWMRRHNLPVAYTVPSLVDHADGPSLAVHGDANDRRMPRVAWRFGGRERWGREFLVM